MIGVIRQIGRVVGGAQWYSVFFGSPAGTQRYAEEDLEPHTEYLGPLDSLRGGHLAGYQDFQRLITYQRILRDDPLSNHLYAFNASRTRFYPYQFKPLLKILASPRQRLLIADEVGLGKTIEAGLILTELRARQTVRRVLIICPSNLTDKWKMELKRRFDEDFRKYASADFLDFLKEYEASPEKSTLSGILPLESMRRQEVQNALKATAPDLDLVIIDEAHHMRNFGTLQRAAGLCLSRNASAMVMLTATPVHLGSENLYSLLNILDGEDFADLYTVNRRFQENEPIVKAQNCLGRFPPVVDEARRHLLTVAQTSLAADNPLLQTVHSHLDELERETDDTLRRRLLSSAQRDLAELNLIGHIFSRTRKRQVQEGVAQRHAFSLEIDLTPTERTFYKAVSDYVRAESASRISVPIIQKWLLNTPQRRVASSIPAMVAHYRELLGEETYGSQADLNEEDLDVEFLEDLSPVPDFEEARRRLARIVATWPENGPDSKYHSLTSVLRQIKVSEGRLKVLVFAFFKDTLKYLHTRLARDGFSTRVISGDVSIEERLNLINHFREDEDIEVMLSSRVGSEGLDFQFCNIMFNYDLPWNPMDVEQRIGRLDRIGQESPVIRIYNFWIKGTIEERILRRLFDRIHIFERSIGELELILGDTMKQIEQVMLSPELSPREVEHRVEQTALIIESRMQQLEQLEKDSAIFIGTDSFFEEEVEQIRRKKRYVTGEQIHHFLKDFIHHNCPRTRLVYKPDRMEGSLVPDQALHQFIIDQGMSHDLTRFLNDHGQGVPITFSSEIAYRNPQYEFINLLHPLLQAVVTNYAAREAEREAEVFSGAHRVVLGTDHACGLRPGYYFYFIYIFRVQAARPVKTLEMVLLTEELTPALDMETAELLLGEMVESGREPVGPELEIDPNLAEDAAKKAEEIFLHYVELTRRQVEHDNELYIRRRLDSLERTYEKNISAQQELLDRGRREGNDPRYLRMREGTIRRLEGELDFKRSQIESQRRISVSSKDLVAGLLEVIEEP